MAWLQWRIAIAFGLLATVVLLVVGFGDLDYWPCLLLAWPCVVACGLVAERQKPGLIIYGALAVMLVGLFAWSQAGPGLHPAPTEWVVFFGFAGLLIAFVGMWATDEILARVGVVAIVVLQCCAGCVAAFPGIDDFDTYRPTDPGDRAYTELWQLAADSEVRPAPSATNVAYTGCYGIMTHGCFPLFTVTATDGVPRDALLERVVSHYIGEGWPLEREQLRDGSFLFRGCRPVRGILPYYDHCMEIFEQRNAANPNYVPSRVPEEGNSVRLWVGTETPP
jgi:hypothetical protein